MPRPVCLTPRMAARVPLGRSPVLLGIFFARELLIEENAVLDSPFFFPPVPFQKAYEFFAAHRHRPVYATALANSHRSVDGEPLCSTDMITGVTPRSCRYSLMKLRPSTLFSCRMIDSATSSRACSMPLAYADVPNSRHVPAQFFPSLVKSTVRSKPLCGPSLSFLNTSSVSLMPSVALLAGFRGLVRRASLLLLHPNCSPSRRCRRTPGAADFITHSHVVNLMVPLRFSEFKLAAARN